MGAMEWVVVNGELRPAREPAVSAFDAGLTIGLSLFETMRAYGRALFLYERHMRRFRAGAEVLGFRIERTDGEIARDFQRLFEANRLEDAEARLTLTPGTAPRYAEEIDASGPVLIAAAAPLKRVEESVYERGCRTLSVEAVSAAIEGESLARLKTGSRALYALARRKAEERGCFEAILKSPDGQLREGAASNLFLVFDDRLYTPPLDVGILPGTRRELILELAGAVGLPVREMLVYETDLAGADEMAIANALIEIVPVVRYDERTVGAGKPGKWTRTLMREYRRRADCDAALASGARNIAESGAAPFSRFEERRDREAHPERTVP